MTEEIIDDTMQTITDIELLENILVRIDMIYSLGLFVLSCVVGIFVCYILYRALKTIM